jgi:hypothetical protein
MTVWHNGCQRRTRSLLSRWRRARSKSSGGGGGIVGKISNKLGAKNNSGFQRFDDGVEMQNGKGGLGVHM